MHQEIECYVHQTKQKIQNGLVLPTSSFLFGNESCVNTLLIVINPGINSILGTPEVLFIVIVKA